MYARLAVVTGPAERAKEARQTIVEQFVPKARELPAVKGAYFMADDAGKIAVLTIFESEADLVASRDSAQRLREAAAGALGGTVQSVDELEIFASF